jgi:hypothetical protein
LAYRSCRPKAESRADNLSVIFLSISGEISTSFYSVGKFIQSVGKMRTVSDVMACYEKGIYTKGEIVSHFIKLAAERPPETFVGQIPHAIVIEMMQEVNTRPQSLEDVIWLGGNDPISRLAWFNGAQRLHDYFLDSSPQVNPGT